MIPSDLFTAYLTTSYQVFNLPFSIHIGAHHPHLDLLLQENKSETWAFITAFNPRSEILSDEENLMRHKMLRNDLSDFKCFEGQGVGLDPDWKPELSFLVLGISEEVAKTIGMRYNQNAIVTGKKGGPAELTLLAQF